MSITTALIAIPQILSLVEQALPVASELLADAKTELANIMAGAAVSATQIQQDDAALDAADAALQAAQSSSSSQSTLAL